MAYQNTLYVLDILSKIPEDFAVYNAVQYVLLKCAVEGAHFTACRRSELGAVYVGRRRLCTLRARILT
jgi:hypothetical protein